MQIGGVRSPVGGRAAHLQQLHGRHIGQHCAVDGQLLRGLGHGRAHGHHLRGYAPVIGEGDVAISVVLRDGRCGCRHRGEGAALSHLLNPPPQA